ncbi:MAG: response regulator transcription factor, partial [Acholeplasmataceae bacterium]|nr:response regulator transcription factor [Acholeplasmataceae bacterium]
MKSILVISKESNIFNEAAQLFCLEDYHVNIISIDLFDHELYQINSYDFILFHLEFLKKTNEDILRFIMMDAKCPIFVLSKSLDEAEQIHYLKMGAQFYVEIPFSASLLVSQIISIIDFMNRSQTNIFKIYRFGPVSIDLENRKIINENGKTHMTTVEFKILNVLISYKDQIVSKEKLIHRVWDHSNSATDNALGIHIARLRKKLDCCDAFQL